MTGVRLGAFELVEQLGSGAMGSVHLARVLRGPGQGREIAVKILSARHALAPDFRALFRREIAGVAALDHPRIVSIYDYGEVDDAAQEASDGGFVSGSPWLAMELVRGGTLSRPGLPWGILREALLGLIDALGHAHARGVVHRDVKPGNILMGRDGLKLGDFGLVYSFGESDRVDARESRRMGTPSYMSPEQFQGRWRDFGPWTDLYAVGCLAYALSTGRPPYGRGKTMEESMMGHLHETPAPLVPLRDVPAGFEGWIRRMIEKRPVDRYGRAADAARALLALGDPVPGVAIDLGGPSEPEEVTLLNTPELTTVIALQERAAAKAAELRAAAPGGEGAEQVRIPVPLNWRRTDEDQKPRWIQGLGLQLFGLRTVPFVGREAQREQVWRLLRRVGREGSAARLVVLRGETGVGKTRLAEWVCERSHELGVATVLRAMHGPRPGALRGVRAMVARHLRCSGLDREQVIERVLELYSGDPSVDRDEAEAIAGLLAPASQEDRDSGIRVVQFERPEEWYGVLERMLARLAARRPVVLSLDDVHWGLDALGFTLHLLRRQSTHPSRVLVVMTVQDEGLDEHSIEARWLEELEQDEHSTVLRLEPLNQEEQAKLTRVGLGLSPVLAEQIDRRARGVPLYAVQLVTQWAEEGRLEGAGRGFQLREEVTRRLPETLAAVWRERVQGFLDQRSEADGKVLELASALGEDGVELELQQVCELSGVAVSPGLIDDLVAHRLARRVGGGGNWAFSSGMIHEVLESRAREAGRLEGHHASCAAVLARLGGPFLEERLAGHFVLAGQSERALEPLHLAAQERHRCGEFIVARRLLDGFHSAAEACQLPEADIRRGRAILSEAIVARGLGDFERGLDKIQELERLAIRHGWNEILAAAKLAHANHHQDHFEVAQARPLYREALSLFEAEENTQWEVSTWNNLGLSHAYSGEHDAALECFQSALERAGALGDLRGLALAHEGLASLALHRGDARVALVHGTKSMELSRQGGHRSVESRAYLLLGDVARLGGDPELGEEHYRAAVALLESVGAAVVTVAEAHVAWSLMEQERFREALPMVRDQLLVFKAEKREHFVATSQCCLLVCAAVDGDWNRWWEHLSEAEKALNGTGFVDFTCARLVAQAASQAQQARRNSDARRAYLLALSLWEKLGWADEIAETKSKLEALN